MKKVTLQDLNSAVATANRKPLNTGAARPVVRKAEEVQQTAFNNLSAAKYVRNSAWKEKEALKERGASIEKGQFEAWMKDLYMGSGPFKNKADFVQQYEELSDEIKVASNGITLVDRKGNPYVVGMDDLRRAYCCFLADVQKQQITVDRRAATGRFLYMQKEVIIRTETFEEAKKQNNFEKIILREVIPQDYPTLLKQERTAIDSLVTMGEALVKKG